MPRRRSGNTSADASPPPKRSRYNFRSTRARRQRASKLAKDLEGRKHEVISDTKLKEKIKILEVDEKPGAGLKIDLIDLHLKENRKLHHTSRYEQDDLIVRRGQKFQVSLKFDRNVDVKHDTVILQFAFGSLAIESKNTLVRVPVSMKKGGSNVVRRWCATTETIKDSSIICNVTTPSNCKIGKYDLFVETCLKEDSDSVRRFKYGKGDRDGDFIVIFNPWNKDDVVYMEDDKQRNEYVMNDHGAIWVGSWYRNRPRPWSFSQFEEPCLEAVFRLLDLGDLDSGVRGSAVSIIRKLSAMTNSMDDDGLLEGRWTETYPSGCTKPWEWTGSQPIIQKYMDSVEPVQYGQCWVFSAVITTLLRAVGIPTRSVTNFESAHDTDLSMTIDYHVDEDGESLDDLDDSKWNFHVWNESWLRRPDLPEGYDGWQAHDATPQEASEDVMRCGPASLKAIKEGHVYLHYDVGFIFSEVNGDRVFWELDNKGSMKVTYIDSKTVGKCISTKAVGSYARHDLTLDYKYPEGSLEEKRVLKLVNRYSSRSDEDIYNIANEKELEFRMELPSTTLVGDDIVVKLVVTNKVKQIRNVKVKITLASAYYTGISGKRIVEEKQEIKLQPNEEKTITLDVAGKEYEKYRNPEARFMVMYHARNMQTNRVYADTDNFCLEMPEFELQDYQAITYGQDSELEVSFKNTTKMKLTNAAVTFDSNGYLSDGVLVYHFKKPIQPGEKVTATFSVKPRKRYRWRAKVTGLFSCDQLSSLSDKAFVRVFKPKNEKVDDDSSEDEN